MRESTFSIDNYEQEIALYVDREVVPRWREAFAVESHRQQEALTLENQRRQEAITIESQRQDEDVQSKKRSKITVIIVLCVCVIGVAAVILWKYNQPINVYTRAIERNPKDAEAYYNRGQIYDENKEFDQAVMDYNRAIAFNPNYAAALNSRGRIYIDRNDYKRAIEDLNASLEIIPDDANVLETRAAIWEKFGVLIQAATDWEAVLKIRPLNSDYQEKLNIVKATIDEYDKEIASFTTRLRSNPNDAAAYNSRGWRYYLKGDYQKALEDSNTSLKLRPNHANTLDTRASAYQGLSDTVQAIADWEAAVKLDPNNAEFKDKLEKTKAGIDIRPGLVETIKNTPRDGTYTFNPRLRGNKGGNASDGWLAKIVIHDGLMDLFLTSASTGKGRKSGLSFGPPSTLTLKDLDNTSKIYSAIQDARWDENTGAWIITFRNVASKRFTYIETQPNPNWIINEIILGRPD